MSTSFKSKLSSITLYILPSCVQCYATKKYLEKNNLSYDIVDISKNAEAYSFVKSLGYLGAPVLVSGDRHWSGFKPELISEFLVG